MNQALVGGAERLRSSVSAILSNYQDARLAASVNDEVNYLIACSESDCAADEMIQYIHTVLDPRNSTQNDHHVTSVIIRAMVDVIAGD